MRPAAEAVVLSDDPILGSLVRDLLDRERLSVVQAADEAELRGILERCRPPLVVVDGILGTPETRALLSRLPILSHGHAVPQVLLLTGSGAPTELREDPRVTATLVVPFSSRELVQAVVQLLPPRRDHSETRLRVETPVPENGTG